MDTRYDRIHNERNAALVMLPGGISGLAVNAGEGGPTNIVVGSGSLPQIMTTSSTTPRFDDLVKVREAIVKKYQNSPYAKSSTFENVLGAMNLDKAYTKTHKSELPVDNFHKIESEIYLDQPDIPVVMNSTIGVSSRNMDRWDAVKYD